MFDKYNVHAVIGSAFGDEGKGRHVDYLSSKSDKEKTIVIRFNGGSQAGHNVVTPEGKHHTFGHFGSGSFLGISTYLTQDFICNPIIFRREYGELVELLGEVPTIYLHKSSMITTPYDMLFNQIIENIRDEDRHGSCGLGINATVLRYENDTDGLYRNMITRGIDTIEYILSRAKTYTVNELHRYCDSHNIRYPDNELAKMLENEDIIREYLKDIKFMKDHAIIVDDSEEVYEIFSNLIFEGAQGLMLDRYNRAYRPYLTTSRTGTSNIKKELDIIASHSDVIGIELCIDYCTRCYMTRHGSGKFASELNSHTNGNDGSIEYYKDSYPDIRLSVFPEYEYNITNEWQGSFRYGLFDDIVLRYIDLDYYGLLRDIDSHKYYVRRRLIIGHIDEYMRGNGVRYKYICRDQNDILSVIDTDIIEYLDGISRKFNMILSSGQTRNDSVSYSKYKEAKNKVLSDIESKCYDMFKNIMGQDAHTSLMRY